MHIIYLIWNRISGKYYVGQTKRGYKRRWQEHRSLLSHGRHGNQHLQRAWDRYGADAFEFYVLDILETKVEADSAERALKKWFDELGLCYNICDGGEGRTGPMSEEAKRKIAEANRGRKWPPRSEEWREKLRAANLGKKQSPETIEKRRAKHSGSKRSEETRKNMSGRPCSEATREKISQAHKGKVLSQEHRRRIKESWERRREKGLVAYVRTEEIRQKASEAGKRRFAHQRGESHA